MQATPDHRLVPTKQQRSALRAASLAGLDARSAARKFLASALCVALGCIAIACRSEDAEKKRLEVKRLSADLADGVDAYEGFIAFQNWPAIRPRRDVQGWERYYAERNERLTNLKSQFQRWRTSRGDSSDPFKKEFDRMEVYVRRWIADQEKRLELSRRCFDLSNRLANLVQATACLDQTITRFGAQWSRTSQELHNLLIELRSAGAIQSY